MNVSIVIQAGGQSSRMGVEKGLVELCGKPMIQHIIDRLSPFASEMLITTNKPENYKQFGLPMYADIYKDYGALAGLHTALSFAVNEMVFVIACDLPFVNIELFKFMKNLFEAKKVDIVIPRTPNGLEPLYAFYRKNTCLPLVTEVIHSGKRRLISWHENAMVHAVSEEQIRKFDKELVSFANINTPEELELAQLNCHQE
jgi:molybdopterin-guanine dinucleotide biosynthesis protein A